MFVKPQLSDLLLCAYSMWHVCVLLSMSVASGYASVRTSGPSLLPNVSRMHRWTKTKTNRIRQRLTMAPFWA